MRVEVPEIGVGWAAPWVEEDPGASFGTVAGIHEWSLVEIEEIPFLPMMEAMGTDH